MCLPTQTFDNAVSKCVAFAYSYGIPCRIHGKLECSNLEVLRINMSYTSTGYVLFLYIYSSLSKI